MNMLPIENIAGEGFDYEENIIDLSKEAENYLQSFKWCKSVKRGWLAEQWGHILCVFYFEIVPLEGSNADDTVWVIVGDIPSAYIDTETASSAKEALEAYVFLMKDWYETVLSGQDITECYPVKAEPTIEHANMLKSRIEIIETDIIPEIE